MSTSHRPEHAVTTEAAERPDQQATDDDAQLARDRRRDLLAGGDATRAPHSLSATELHPIEGSSSGTSWDDPDEL
jgi:hypothetical protein